MKNVVYYIVLILVAVSANGCNDDEKMSHVYPEKTGFVKDREGNEYKWVRYNGLDWLTSNFRAGDPYYDAYLWDSYWEEETYISFDDKAKAKEDFEIYGNLYTYEEAVKNADLLPEGWRLPTDEDWRKLEQALGMSAKTALREGWRGHPVGERVRQDSCGSDLNLMLGGFVGMVKNSAMLKWKFCRMGEYGYYWSATERKIDNQEIDAVYYRSIRYNSSEMKRELMMKGEISNADLYCPVYMSVRYVRDVQDD